MTARSNSNVLRSASAGCHVCQFHSDATSLAASVAQFAAGGLERGDGVILVATQEHMEAYVAALSELGADVAAARASGQLVCADAEAKLAEFERDGALDWSHFERSVTPLLEAAARRGGTTRVHGEVVSLLWRAGRHAEAVRLEEYWNDLLRRSPFALFCSYLLDALDERSYEGPLHEIGRTHSDVLPTKDDDRLLAAVDAASEDLLGLSFSLILGFSGREQNAGEHRLPIGRRTLLWLQRNMPVTSNHIFERARHHVELERTRTARH